MTLLESLRSRKADIIAAAQRHGARRVRIFGSTARGEERPDSDIDFVVDLEPGRSLLDLGGLLADLEALLGAKRMSPTTTATQRSDSGAAQRNLMSISPFFIVRDLQASVAHYITRFGFQLDFQGPAGDVYYARVSRDGIGILLKAIQPDVLPQPNHTRHEWARWDAYLYTLDPDPLYQEFKRRGASFVKELSFIDDGLWGFEVTDADGYVLAFFRTGNEG